MWNKYLFIGLCQFFKTWGFKYIYLRFYEIGLFLYFIPVRVYFDLYDFLMKHKFRSSMYTQ